MKRLISVTIFAMLCLILSPQPYPSKGQNIASESISNCPDGVVFVGNTVVDLHTSSLCSVGGELYWARDDVEITGSRGQAFYRDTGLIQGGSYTYRRCCDYGASTDSCTTYGSVTLGEINGHVCQDLSWSSGIYDYPTGRVDVIHGAALSITGATVKHLRITNETPSASSDPGGDIRINNATLEDSDIVFESPGTSYLKNSIVPNSQSITKASLVANETYVYLLGKADVEISGNTFYSMTLTINGEDNDPGPRATISDNVFHGSNVKLYDSRSVTTIITSNIFYWDHLVLNVSSIYQDGSHTYIGNNEFYRIGNADSTAQASAVRVGTSYSDDPWANATIEYNTFKGFTRYSEKGIYLYNRVANATITGNTIQDNNYGIYTSSDVQATIHDNCIVGNSTGLQGLNTTVDARYNWWGDASGPTIYLNPGGTGDKITGGSGLFVPWLTSANCNAEPPATLKLTFPNYKLTADGLAVVEITAELTDQQGPVAGATISFDHSPRLGNLWPSSVKTNAQGRAVVHYQVPSAAVLGTETEIHISAVSGNAKNLVAISFEGDTPSIVDVQVVGIGTVNNVPETGKRVAIIVEYTDTPGYEVTELIILTRMEANNIYHSVLDNQFTWSFIPPTGPGTHGMKYVTLALKYKNTSTSEVRVKLWQKVPIPLFFGLEGDDDGDTEPNWFEYWGADGAVPNLEFLAQQKAVVYNAALGMQTDAAYITQNSVIQIGSRAALEKPAMSIPKGPGCPGLTTPLTQGIYTLDGALIRELWRADIYKKWLNATQWKGQVDSDDFSPTVKTDDLLPADNIPDTEELKLGTLPDDVDSCSLSEVSSSYSLYGDQEVYILRNTQSARGNNVFPKKDWANPGEQTVELESVQIASQFTPALTERKSGPAYPLYPTYAEIDLSGGSGFASLTGSYSDNGVDTDGDSLYEQLQLSVGIDVNKEEVYNIVAWLESSTGVQVAWAATQMLLTPGMHNTNLFFDGQLLMNSGFDGPYTISTIELRMGPRELLLETSEDVHTTSSYATGDFDPPVITFTGTFSDSGVDSGSDGLFDQLSIDVGLDVKESGSYTITGELSGTHTIAVGQVAVELTAGNQTVPLRFNGVSIYQNREDGPYNLKALRVEDASGNKLDFLYDAYTTGAYTYAEFQHSSTTFEIASYVDQGIDDNQNGKYDSLRFSFDVDIDHQDTYLILAHLINNEGEVIHNLAQMMDLDAGHHTLDVDFYGRAISSHGVDGPYIITSLALFNSDGELVDHHPLAHYTQNYTWTEFEYLGFIYLPSVLR